MSTATPDPKPELDPRYSTPDADATPWEEARDTLICADLYWIASVRSSGQPHVTPLLSVWADGAMHISTGDDEQKARNLAANPACTLGRSEKTRHGYSIISEIVPAPTVRPPSRMANRLPLSMATGVINSAVIGVLSPGITISTPSGSFSTPVTSVVRM